MANSGYAQGRSQTIQLPKGGYVAGLNFSGYGGHDPYLNSANPYANGASQAGALGVGGAQPGGGFGIGGQLAGIGGNAGIMGAAAGYASAQDANKALENELKAGYDARTKQGMDDLSSLSDQDLADVNKIFDNKQNQLRRQFGGGGSTNQSTVLASVLAQNEGERAAALNRARDSLALKKASLRADLSGDALAQRERVTNAYPDLGLAANLAEKAGAAQAPMRPEYQPQGQMPQQPGYEPQQQGYGPETHNGFGGPVQGNQPQDMRRMSYDAKRNGYKSVAEWQKAGSPGATATSNSNPQDMRQLSYAAKRAGYGSVAEWQKAGGVNAAQKLTPAQKTAQGIKQAQSLGSGISAGAEMLKNAAENMPKPTYEQLRSGLKQIFPNVAGTPKEIGYMASILSKPLLGLQSDKTDVFNYGPLNTALWSLDQNADRIGSYASKFTKGVREKKLASK